MGNWSWISFIHSQWTKLPPLPTVDMSERTVMVVGANIGLGLETVRHFAQMKPKHLVLACRSKAKGEVAVTDIKETIGFHVELLLVDMASFASVSAFASSFEEKYGRLDILALNAGVMQYHYEATVDGLEMNTQVNHLSTMLIALLLLPLMQRTAEEYHTFPHIIITTSNAHFLAPMTSDLICDPAPVARICSKDYSTNRDLSTRYPLTKMLNMLLVRGLTSRLPASSPIVACGVHPGYCQSGLFRHVFFPMTVFYWLLRKTLIRETAEGAKTIVHAGLSGLPEIERTEREAMRGAYMSECRPEEPADFLFTQQGKTFEDKVWNESIEILTQKDPRVRLVVAQYLSGKV